MGIVKFFAESSSRDEFELNIRIESASAMMRTEMYVSEIKIIGFIKQIENYALNSNFGLLSLQFGEFGHEYAGGAVYFRFNTKKPDEISLSIYAESNHTKTFDSYVAENLKMHCTTDYREIENFICGLKKFLTNEANEAILKITNY